MMSDLVIERSRWQAFECLRGMRPADTVINNAQIVDVNTGKIFAGGLAIAGGRVARAGDVDDLIGESTQVIDAKGRFLTPGLIDTHSHSYHCHLSMTEYARLCLRRGTTTITESAYGQGQVGGAAAVRLTIEELRRTPINALFQLPILAYLQNVELGLKPTPNRPSEEQMMEMLDWPGCVGLEEPPAIPYFERDPGIERMTAGALQRGQVVMGHAADLKREDLEAYASMGITSDHECVTAEEAVERVAAGIMVSIRECSIARNQNEVQRAITEMGVTPDRFMFNVDVPDAPVFMTDGHVDHHVRLAIAGGISPVDALRMATINAARYYRVDHDLGSLAPGRRADVLIVGDLEKFDVHSVIANGQIFVEDGEEQIVLRQPIHPHAFTHSMAELKTVRAEDLALRAPAGRSTVKVRAIDGSELYSREVHAELTCVDGVVQADPGQDILKIAMIDRNGVDCPPGMGFIKGYGLKRGAIGTSYNPYFNNPLGVGVNDAEVAHAINEVSEMGGGFVVVAEGKVLGRVRLPLFGLLSDLDADRYVAEMAALNSLVHELGCPIESPFQQLAFCIVGGELFKLKLAIGGMFDVEERRYLSPFVD
jgi:adenine deaminase